MSAPKNWAGTYSIVQGIDKSAEEARKPNAEPMVKWTPGIQGPAAATNRSSCDNVRT